MLTWFLSSNLTAPNATASATASFVDVANMWPGALLSIEDAQCQSLFEVVSVSQSSAQAVLINRYYSLVSIQGHTFLSGSAANSMGVGNATATSSGHVPTPPNNTTSFLDGTANWSTPPGGGTATIATFNAVSGMPPSSAYAYFATRDSGGLGVMQFTKTGNTDTSLVFPGVVPAGVTWATGLTATLFWASQTATAGAVEWAASFDNVNAHSIDTDTYGTAVSVANTTSITAASMNTTVIQVPTANLQSLAAEQPYKLLIKRRASDTTPDTMTDIASLFLVEVKTY